MARCSDMLLEILGIQRLNYIAHKISMGKNADYFYITAFCYFKFLLLFSHRFTQPYHLQDDLAPSRVKHNSPLTDIKFSCVICFQK